FYIELWDRDYRSALARAGGREPAGWFWEDWLVNDHVRRAVTLRLLGDSGTALVQFDSARAQLEAQLPGAARRQVHNSIESALAIAYATHWGGMRGSSGWRAAGGEAVLPD